MVGMGISPSFSIALSSSSPSKRSTIWFYVPFSIYAELIDFFNCVDILAYRKVSIICWALSPNARWACLFNFSKKFSIDSMFGLIVILCHLCLAVALDSSWTYFCRNTKSTTSEVLLPVAFMLRSVCNAFFSKVHEGDWFSLQPSSPLAFWALYGRISQKNWISHFRQKTILCC